MKIALSLFGFFGNREDLDAGTKAHAYLNNILPVTPDVYIHSWNPELEETIKSLYLPKNSIFENNYNFKEVMQQNGISREFFDEGFNREATIFKNAKIENTLSFLYSRKKSLELVPESNQYDAVISCRFDIGFRGGPEVRYLRFDPALGMEYIYSAMWNQLNSGYADMWFYSNYKNMMLFGKTYDRAIDYFKPDSEYYQRVTQGWPDSKMHDGAGLTEAVEQFSNERLLKDTLKAKELMKWPKWQCINNHMLYKWFFIESGLYNKSKFV